MSALAFKRQLNILYKTTTGKKVLKIDLFHPKGKLKATLLYAHGGGFTKGSRKDKTAQQLAQKLCGEGVAIASVDYRLKTDISAFSPENQKAISTAQARTVRVGMPINPHFCGPRLYAALEDMSDAITYLRQKDGPLAGKTGPLLAFGVSAGGIAALSLAFLPRGSWEGLAQPDAAIGLCAAMVQPWRLSKDGLPSLLFNGYRDRVISPLNTKFIARRAVGTSAPLEVITTDTNGHNPQIDLFINGHDLAGKPWLDRARRMMHLMD